MDGQATSQGHLERKRRDADFLALHLVEKKLCNWLTAALMKAPEQKADVNMLRCMVWSEMPEEVRTSWVALKVGDEISKKLKKMKNVSHDKKHNLWYLDDGDSLKLF